MQQVPGEKSSGVSAVLQTLTADVLESSDIEGEKLDGDQVRSSIARRLGLDIGAPRPAHVMRKAFPPQCRMLADFPS